MDKDRLYEQLRIFAIGERFFGDKSSNDYGFLQDEFDCSWKRAWEIFETEICEQGYVVSAVEVRDYATPSDNEHECWVSDYRDIALSFEHSLNGKYKEVKLDLWSEVPFLLYAIVYVFCDDVAMRRSCCKALYEYCPRMRDLCNKANVMLKKMQGYRLSPLSPVSPMTADTADAGVEEAEEEIICIDSDYGWLKGATLEKRKENAEVLRKKLRQWYEADHKKGYKTRYLLQLKAAYFDKGAVIKERPTPDQFNNVFGDIFTIKKDTLNKWKS